MNESKPPYPPSSAIFAMSGSVPPLHAPEPTAADMPLRLAVYCSLYDDDLSCEDNEGRIYIWLRQRFAYVDALIKAEKETRAPSSS